MCHVGWDDDGVAFWNEKERRARKEYRCACCGVRIAVGKKYVYTVYVSERGDKPQAAQTCIACDAVAEKFGDEHDGKPFPHAIHRLITDCIAEGDEESQRWQPMIDEINARAALAKLVEEKVIS